MTIENLKQMLEDGSYDLKNLIFVIKDLNFIPLQYIERISELTNLSVVFTNEIPDIDTNDIFGMQEDVIYIYQTDTFKNTDIINMPNLYIICNKNETNYTNIVVNVPKLESWQIKDYVYSVCDGVDTTDLDKLLTITNNDIFRLNQESKKISIFDITERKNIFKEFIADGIFNDLSSFTIFDFVQCLLTKNTNQLVCLLKELENIDINDVGLVVLLLQSVRKYIYAYCSTQNLPEYNMSDKQFYYLKKNCPYNRPQLFKIFELLTDMDRKLKTGEIETKYWVDYIIIKIFSI